MLLDKKRVSQVTKIGAIVITVAFIVGYIPYFSSMLNPSSSQGSQAVSGASIAQLEQAVQQSPQNVNAWILLGNAYMDGNNFPKAIDAYGKALELDPKNVPARVDRAISYFYSGQISTAVAEAKEAIKVDPKFVQAYYNMAIFLTAEGKNEEAIKAYEEVLKLNSSGDMADRAKAQIDTLKKLKAPAVPSSGNN